MEQIHQCIEDYIEDNPLNPDAHYAKQVFLISILHNCFGINFGNFYFILSSDRAQYLKNFIKDSRNYLVSRSWAYKQANILQTTHNAIIQDFAAALQDYFYCKVGDMARERINIQMHGVRQKITPPAECFFGLVPPSQIFPKISVFERGRLMPFFNAMIFQHIQHISSIEEVVGNLKAVEFHDNQLCYRLAGQIGFLYRPPKLGDFYFFFGKLKPIFKIINLEFNNYHIQSVY